MQIVQLRADNFRRFEHLSLPQNRPFSGRLNLFVGENAAGKTTLLEMLYCLNRGRSFRGTSPQELLGKGKAQWTVFSKLRSTNGFEHAVGLQWSSSGVQARIDGKPAVASELLRLAPAQILEPGMHKILLDGPTYRRSFIDWGVFHVEHVFLDAWRRYRRALRQRNQLLRQQRSEREIAAWEPELAESGDVIHRLRLAHLQRIAPRARQRIQALLAEGEWEFELHPGWPAQSSLREVLAQQRKRDLQFATTMNGPHRAELKIRAGERSVRNRISRGQQKLLLAALLLSQCEEIHAQAGVAPILLVDDFTAELAVHYQRAFLGELQAYAGQVFITAFELNEVLQRAAPAVFHVEHGTAHD
ncbi:DNA replication/repair protein RecF [Solimonas soli]|uniref:DNA replication/repair protein RecF n=1 Tax=Solimonas soli TaxID=413479 RepID=UPI0004BCCD30|nr:DNA replication/repair protein RecF [Solimonas soli]